MRYFSFFFFFLIWGVRPSIELCCYVVFDLSCNGLFRFFFFVLFVFLLLLPLMANKVVCDTRSFACQR